MMTNRVMFRLLIVSFFLVSCARSQAIKRVENNDFQLEQKWIVSADEDIYTLAASQDWVVIGTHSKLIAVDPATGLALWTKDFHHNSESPLLIQDQIVAALDSEQIKLIEKSGKEFASI